MAVKTKSDENPAGRSVSAVLLDFVFGEPMPQPEVVEHDNEQAWQEWLDAKARQDGAADFEETQPMPPMPPAPMRPR